MTTALRLRRLLFGLAVAAILAMGIAACGGDDSSDTTTDETASGAIEDNPDNHGVQITVGSKNFTEQIVLGEIYAQALEAAGYDVKTDLNLGSEQIALKAIEAGEVDAYPEYTSTALTSFFGVESQDVPADPQQGFEQAKAEFEKQDLTAYPPTPFESANAVGTLTSTAEDLGLTTVSDLEGQSQNLTLSGSPECRQRVDCLVGLEQDYGLTFEKFTPVDIALRYEVLDKGQSDLSILFTTDAQLSVSDKYTILEDDKDVFPPGNVIFVARQDTVDEAGPDFADVIARAQQDLTDEVMQELNARVDIDKEDPADAAAEYLQQAGLVE